MTLSKLTKFSAAIGALSSAIGEQKYFVSAISLDQHQGTRGIFSAMMEIETGEETREKEKQEGRDRKKKQFEEAEKEHQALIEQEEEEETSKERQKIDSAQKMLMEHHHAKALDRLNELSPILLDNTQIQSSLKLANESKESLRSMMDAAAE